MVFCITRKRLSVLAAVMLVAVFSFGAYAAEDKPLEPAGFAASGVSELKAMQPQLDGSGVKIGVISRSLTYLNGIPQSDYLCDVKQPCLTDANLSFYDVKGLGRQAGMSGHNTKVCSILFGLDPNAYSRQIGDFNYAGAVPEAEGKVYEFWHFVYANVFEGKDCGVDLLTASFGSGFEDWWTRGIDAMVEQEGIIVVAAIGNGQDVFDLPLYPAAGANAIGVGVVDSVGNSSATPEYFALANPKHSSAGPTIDGRCKPDIVAPGNFLVPKDNAKGEYEPAGNWSSFSTPMAAGAAGLLLQKVKEDAELSRIISADGGNCVIKAILMNSAAKLPYWHKGKVAKDDDHAVPLDYVQGAGMLNALAAYQNLVAGRQGQGEVNNLGWDKDTLDKTAAFEKVYQLKIDEPNDKMITATAVWNVHYSDKYPFEAAADENSNLRLEVWAVDVNEPQKNYMLDYSDSNVDNVEHVYCKSDANFTNYEIVVSYSGTESGGRNQVYGAAWHVSRADAKDNILWYDLNVDGVVDEADIEIISSRAAGAADTTLNEALGDINGDGRIDADDIGLLAAQKNRQADWFGK